MSLMKLSARLRAHDWTAALIELLIVILGILIALQVSNWNQDRLDRVRADSYYQRLQAELAADLRAMDVARGFWAQVAGFGRAAIAHSETGQRVDDSNWKTVLAYYHGTQIMPIELEDTTFSEMRDGGDLQLIANEDLRKHLADYYRLTGTGMRAHILRHDPVYRIQVRGLTPTAVQEYIWKNCFRQLEGTNQELIDCPSPISEDEAGNILTTYRASPSLLENLRYWNSTLAVSGIVIDGAQKSAASLLADVGKARAR